MALTCEQKRRNAAERQRQCRAKKTAAQVEERRRQERMRYHENKAAGKVKAVGEISDRAKRKQRKAWRRHSRQYRQRKRDLVNATSSSNTNPSSDDENRAVLPAEEGVPVIPAAEVEVPPATRKRKTTDKKHKQKERSKAERTIKKKDHEKKILERKLERYKKKYQREKKKNVLLQEKLSAAHDVSASTRRNQAALPTPSPRKKVASLVGKEKVSPAVKKQLLAGYALEKQLKSQVRNTIDRSVDSHVVKKSIGNKLLKKYRLQKHFSTIVSRKLKYLKTAFKSSYERQRRSTAAGKVNHLVRSFLEDDKVSMVCPGKRDPIKVKGELVPRRLLLDTMRNTHKRFVNETQINLSFTTFFRLKPAWVTTPLKRHRETCVCIKHGNLDFLVTALNGASVIEEKSISSCLANVACSTKNIKCMTNECESCRYNTVSIQSQSDEINIKFFQWKKIVKEEMIRGETKNLTFFTKARETAGLFQLKEEFNRQLQAMRVHVFNWVHQAEELGHKKTNLQEDELMFRVDFSENYYAKYAKEIQSMHFGASKKQMSLHTGVRYHKTSTGVVCTSFCTISDNVDHQAHAIWAHLTPVLEESASRFPHVTAIHFFSDSPTSQYRNKINIHLMKNALPRYFENLQVATWNFSEPGHGKGPMDGVGGSIKNRADEHVNRGNDITCAKDLVTFFSSQNSKIELYEIDTNAITNMKSHVTKSFIPPVPGITKFYQIMWTPESCSARLLSCFTCLPNCCKHFKEMTIAKSSYLGIDKKLNASELYTDSENEEDSSHQSQGEEGCTNLENEEGSTINPPCDEENNDRGNSEKDNAEKISASDLKKGSYVLVKLSDEKNKKINSFFAICKEDMENEEVLVTFFKRCTKDECHFVLNESDQSYVEIKDVMKILELPQILKKGRRAFYKFKI